MTCKRIVFVFCLLLLLPILITAQDRATWEIYIERDIDDIGTDRVQFINLQTGESRSVQTNGERYTPLNSYLMYFDRTTRMMMTARPDGSIEPHPFIQLGAARRVDWIVSEDERLVAWTLTYDNTNGITTVTTVATSAGTNQNLVLSDPARNDGVRVFPVAFIEDNQTIVMDAQPDGIGELAPYRQYANMFRLSLVDGSITPLPGEPSCFCAAALRAGQLVRLAITSDFSGFDVAIYDLVSEDSNLVDSRGLNNYTQGGDILISPDGTRAVYALSQVEINATEPTVRTIIMLVDLVNRTQSQLTDPVTSYLRSIQWTEDNTAILFSIPERNGTWKIDLATGELTRVANATFIGSVKS